MTVYCGMEGPGPHSRDHYELRQNRYTTLLSVLLYLSGQQCVFLANYWLGNKDKVTRNFLKIANKMAVTVWTYIGQKRKRSKVNDTKLSKSANPNVCLRCRLMTSCHGRMKTSSLFVSAAALNLIFATLSVQFKFNNNVE